MPETIPPATIATAVLLLLHVPPGIGSDNVTAAPAHSNDTPVMLPDEGDGSTAMVLVAVATPQPLLKVYEMTALPAATGVTVPPLTIATPILLLPQMPPAAGSVSAPGEPMQNVDGPLIIPAPGGGLTTMVCVVRAVPQRLVTVYVRIAPPDETPVTVPLEMLATDALLLVHIPPGAGSVSITEPGQQIVSGPVMAPARGCGFTTTVSLANAVPQLFVTA